MEEIMSDNIRNSDILKAITAIEREYRKDPETGYERLMVYVSPFLNGDLPSVSRGTLLRHTITGLNTFNRLDEAEKFVLELMELDPNSVQNLTYASTFYWLNKGDDLRAIAVAESAVALALKSDNFVVSAYEALCRAAKSASNFELLESSLEKALNYQHVEGHPDIRLSDDLLAGVPEGRVNVQLVEKYTSEVSQY